MRWPEKCLDNCPFCKCMSLQYILEKKKMDEFTVRDIRKFYKEEIMPMGKPNRIKRKKTERIRSNPNKDTPNKILTRLKQSHWVDVKYKEDRTMGGRGRLPKVLEFGKKAHDYLKKYESFLTGPLCWRWRKGREEEKNKVRRREEIPVTVERGAILEKE